MSTPTPPGDERRDAPGSGGPASGGSPYDPQSAYGSGSPYQNAPPYPGQPAYPPPGYGMPPERPRNGYGIASLVLGILSILVFFIYAGIWLGIPAIITGFIGRSRAKYGRATNGGMSIAGIILGIIGLLITIGVIVFVNSHLYQVARHCAHEPTRQAQQQCYQNARS